MPSLLRNHSPLEGESQKPSLRAKADAVGGQSRPSEHLALQRRMEFRKRRCTVRTRARRGEWTFSLRGSLDAERTFESAETALEVWGEDLRSESAKNRVLPGLSGVYRWGRFSLGGEVSAGGLGSDDREYSGLLHLGMRF